ncbi:TetR/AcrR family transcriptional regulator [Pseudoxanthomonas sp.]|uniref:TetR/AcrR family transcriptional regulator n=1 Tax=Pseudoxanthomonas sp. TaxID=1871049 RepID=UPI00260B93EC|nr:TetR/AcrR family transcriptional regulator [Pseudoxanthomonas sp.]WDS36739.1 MAG: TetR/AcrR family transcriptional regulator [Pseudoxanthomonas sp.]
MGYPDPTTTAGRRQRVLAAVRALMAEQGFRVSMDAVAQRAGCSKQTLYAQFGSKNALLQDLMQEHLDITTSRLEAFDGQVREPLLAFAIEHLERISAPDVVASIRLFSAESPQFPEEARSIWRDGGESLLARLAAWLSLAMDAGCLRRDQPHVAAEILLSMMLGMDLERQRFSVPQRTPEAQHTWAELAVDTFLRAYAPPPRAAHC